MRAERGSRAVVVCLASLSVSLLVMFLIGCGGSRVSAPAGGEAAFAVPQLTLALQPTLDAGVPGSIKATSIKKAELFNGRGKCLKTAKLSRGKAIFDLKGIAAGEYFIRVNGLRSDLVPTHIADPTQTLTQRVGRKLRASTISVAGVPYDPAASIKTFSGGQKSRPLVNYSNGANVSPVRYGYAIWWRTFFSAKDEVRVLGTGALLTSYQPGTMHKQPAWLIGPENHGKSASAEDCGGCHGDLNKRPARYLDIGLKNGWCFYCHRGPAGPGQGLVNPKG